MLAGQFRAGSLPGRKHSVSTINRPTLNQLKRQKPVFIFYQQWAKLSLDSVLGMKVLKKKMH